MKLINRSKWPTPALKVLSRWVVNREPDLPDDYTITMRATKRQRWGGHGGRFGQTITVYRRWGPFPTSVSDRRFKWAPQQSVNTRVELLVFLLAHEAHHGTEGRPRNFRRGARTDRAAMEFRCNEAGMRAVAALRVEWPVLRAAIYRAMRLERVRVQVRGAKAAVKRSDPTPKLLKARNALAAWQSKAKLANTKIKKYRRRVVYYEGRMAARSLTN